MDKQALIKKRYEFLPHTADAMFRAYGKNLSESFSNAAEALFMIMTEVKSVRAEVIKEIKVVSKNEQALLYDFLEELVYLVDTEGFLLSKVLNLSIKSGAGQLELNATLIGDTETKYEIFGHVKAITYSDMYILEEPGFVVLQVVPDI